MGLQFMTAASIERLTPSHDKPDSCVRAACYTEGGKIAHAYIVVDDQQESRNNMISRVAQQYDCCTYRYPIAPITLATPMKTPRLCSLSDANEKETKMTNATA